ncbi:MAG: hypothetical protein WCB63_15935, partial [Polyangiales bacterium]
KSRIEHPQIEKRLVDIKHQHPSHPKTYHGNPCFWGNRASCYRARLSEVLDWNAKFGSEYVDAA